MSRRVRVSRQAKADLDGIWAYVAERDGIETATCLVDSITGTFPMLGQHPSAGRRRDDIEPGARSFPVGNYLIYYRQRKSGIEISHVIHGMRDQRKAWKGKAL